MGEIIVRKGSDGRLRFYARFVDADGKRKMRKAPGEGMSRPEGEKAARRFLAGIETRIANGRVGIVEPTAEEKARRTVTLGALATRFLAEYASPRIKDLDEYRVQTRSVIKTRLGDLMGRPAAGVAALDVERLRDALTAEGYAARSVHATLITLSRIYTWGRKVGAIDCANPVSGVERPAHMPSLDYFSVTEVGQLLAAAEARATELPPGLPAMVATAIYTGARKGELYGMRWADLDLDARRLTIARSYRLAPKSGKQRHVRLHPELVPILRRWRDECPKTAEGLVFPLEMRGGSGWRMGKRNDGTEIEALLAAAGCHLPAKPWHALRHTFASHFIMAGGNILTLQKLLGHADLKMTMIYAHLAPDFMDAEIARLHFPAPAGGEVADLGAARRARELADR